MIKSVTLKDFQNHKSTLMTFVNGVNGIIGPSDVGKSAIVRAFKWVLHNRPSGDEFISHWAKDTSVKIEFDNGSVTRTKGTKNAYVLNDVILEGFGQEVPDVVTQLSNMSDINIQYQLDGPFLLGESPGAIARILNKVVHLDKIDISLSNVRKLESDVKSNITATKKKLENLDNELNNAPDFTKIDNRLSEASRLQFQLLQHEKTLSELEKLKKDIDFCHSILDNINVPDVDFVLLEDRVQRFTELTNECKQLNTLIFNLTTQTELIQKGENELRKCLQTLKSLCPSLCPLCGQPITHTSLLDVCGVESVAKREIVG